MSTSFKILSVFFLILCLFAGAPLVLAPGRFLGAFGWAPIDPLVSRLLGAALLGMAWGAWRVLRQSKVEAAQVLSEVFLIFTLLGAIGWLRNIIGAYWWPGIWGIVGLLLVLAIAWIWARFRLLKG